MKRYIISSIGLITLGCIMWISNLLASGDILNVKRGMIQSKSYEWCSNCSTYEITINVIVVTDIMMEDRMYGYEQPVCTCDTTSTYPIVRDNLDWYNNMDDIIYCYYNADRKIFIDSKYLSMGIMVTLLFFSGMLFIILLIVSIVMSREKKTRYN